MNILYSNSFRSRVGGLISVVAISFVVLACGSQGATSQSTGTVHLKYASVLAATALNNSDVVQTLIDRTKSRLDIQTFYSGQLGGEADELSGVESGTIDMAAITDITLAQVEPAINIIELPYFWKDQDTVNRLISEGTIGQKLMADLESKGLKGLAIGQLGPRTVLSKKPINSISDVKGMKVRVLPGDLFVSEWSAWGADPVQIDAPEVVPALQTGTVAAVDSNATGFLSLKWYQSAKYIAQTDHQYTTEFLVMNLKKWNSLPPDVQQMIQSALKDGVKLNEQRAAKADTDAIAQMAGEGITVTHPDSAGFRDAVQPVWKKYTPQIGALLVAQAEDLQK